MKEIKKISSLKWARFQGERLRERNGKKKSWII